MQSLMLGKASHHHTSLGGITSDTHPMISPVTPLCALHATHSPVQLEHPKLCSPVEPATMAFNFLLCLQKQYS